MKNMERSDEGGRVKDINEEDGKMGERKKKDGVRKNPKKKEQTGWKSEIKDWIQILVAAVVIAFVFDTFIISNNDVPTPSMENTIMTGSRVLGSRIHYKFADPERGDIAVFVFGWRCPVCHEIIEGERQDLCPACGSEVNQKGKTIHYVKRVIGIPGDTIDIIDGKVYLNASDTPLKEPYLPEEMEPHPPYHFEVPDGGYFMMGDNRNDSGDARFWQNPYISRKKIKAKVLFEYFPKVKRLH